MRDLLRFQCTLDRWRCPARAPDATPFVSLYANGRLCGCHGDGEGSPGERLARAFLRAANDGRFDPISSEERTALAAQVSYARRPRLLNPETAADEIEVGTHGVALVGERGQAAMILPHVARDEGLGPRELIDALLRKARAGVDALAERGIYAFETEDVVVRRVDARSRSVGAHAAASWLASLVDAEGNVTFAVDGRARRRVPLGEMHHGRSASVVQALAAHGTRAAVVARARGAGSSATSARRWTGRRWRDGRRIPSSWRARWLSRSSRACRSRASSPTSSSGGKYREARGTALRWLLRSDCAPQTPCGRRASPTSIGTPSRLGRSSPPSRGVIAPWLCARRVPWPPASGLTLRTAAARR
jgi:hypothetical protein